MPIETIPQPELLPGRPDKVASRNAAHFRIWHKQHTVALKSNDFGCDLSAGLAAVNTTNIAYRSLYTRRLNRHADNIFNFSGMTDGFGLLNLPNGILKHNLSLKYCLFPVVDGRIHNLTDILKLCRNARINNLIRHLNNASARFIIYHRDDAHAVRQVPERRREFRNAER